MDVAREHDFFLLKQNRQMIIIAHKEHRNWHIDRLKIKDYFLGNVENSSI